MSNDENVTIDNVTIDKATRVIYGRSPAINSIEVIECSTWREFQERVKFTDIPFSNRVFRGQSESNWRLMSKWDRYQEQKEKVSNDPARNCRYDTPESFLNAFKNNYIGNVQFDTSSLDNEQWMALGRHHGLITPLLDWTKSPYVAAYFAYREHLPRDKELGCLNPMLTESLDGNVAIWEIPLKSVLEGFTDFRVLHSRIDSAYRQKAQSGLFTLLDTELKMTLCDFLKKEQYQHIIRKYLIPKKEAIIAMQDLHLMNINECTMFPDADGAAKQANLGSYLDWLSLLHQIR